MDIRVRFASAIKLIKCKSFFGWVSVVETFQAWDLATSYSTFRCFSVKDVLVMLDMSCSLLT